MSAEIASIRITKTVLEMLRVATYENMGRVRGRINQSDVIGAALTVAAEHPERMADVLREMKGLS